ncbi:MAG: TerB family tellurite resistance protein [Myxococcota bacterium]|nr:TerB family tellurite resistance protein [Myxococcota bacterium]
MLKSLVAVAWADGRVDGEETEVIEALLSSFEIQGDDAAMIREYAKTARSIDDVPITDLSAADRRTLLQHAVILTYIDGEQSEQERAVLSSLVEKLRIPADEAKELLAVADERARRLISLL